LFLVVGLYCWIKVKVTLLQGEKYPCNVCDYEATQKSNLKTHVTKVHGVNSNICKFCKVSH
jgi:hypothetical protein